MSGLTVSVEAISKSFEGVRALRGVDLTIEPGSVHALLGANGSGKSTLVKILTGVYQADAGQVRVGGEVARFASPQQAALSGVRSVQQESPLIETMTVAENFALFRGYPQSPPGVVSWRGLRKKLDELFAQYGIGIDREAVVASLTAAERAIVAMAIALDASAGDVRLLVLDEATASLPESEANQLLDVVAGLAATGLTVLMVTHRVREVVAYAQHVTVLDGGLVSYDDTIEKTSADRLYTLLGAAPADAAEPSAVSGGTGEPVLEVENLTGERVDGVDLVVHRGEILGLAGLADSGAREVSRMLGGVVGAASGSLTVNGTRMPKRLDPRSALGHGVVFVPSDRRREGGAMSLSVLENVLLPQLQPIWKRSRAAERAMVSRAVTDFDIRPGDASAPLGTLSGGNQQKSIIAKWMLTKPAVMVFDDPTSGVDPGSRERIFRLMREAAADGVGIVFLTSEPAQFENICDRVLLLKAGRVASELSGAEITHERIGRWLAE